MTESALQSACLRRLRANLQGAVILKHNDPFISGIPDVSVSLNVVSWIEFKAGAKIKWKNDLQWLTCQRLAKATRRCWVVFYREGLDGDRMTYIIPATNVDRRGNFNAADAEMVAGFDHGFVYNFLRKVHQQ